MKRIKYKIRFIGEVPADFKPEGALKDCFKFYPHFDIDFSLLVENGYIQIISSDSCKWLRSKTSMAEYFKWANGDAEYVPGGFWAPAEKAFGIKRHSLRKLAGENANPLKREESIDFEELKPDLERLREQEDLLFKRYSLFRYLKYLILEKADEANPESIKSVLFQIADIFSGKIVDKKKNMIAA